MQIAVPIVAGTAIRGLVAARMMRGVMQRHPNAFLITLQNYGITLPLHRSQEHIKRDIARGLEAQGRPADAPVVLVGHSQGGLAVLRYAIDHPEQVLHVFSVGAPWHGSHTCMTLTNRIQRITSANIAPAIRDMAPKSRFLLELHRNLPAIAERVTNIYSTHEIFISPYVSAHIDVPGVTNVLIATEREYARHLRTFPDLQVDQLIDGWVTHAGEMNNPAVRSLVWEKAAHLSEQLRRNRLVPPSTQFPRTGDARVPIPRLLDSPGLRATAHLG